jgi:hypothetical protein
MKKTLRATSFCGVLLVLLAAGCGGKVVVDGEPAGAGGSTGTTGNDTASSTGGADTSATSSSTGASGVTCDLLCGGPIGLCGCAGPCSDGNMRAVGCGAKDGGGASCTCQVNNQVVGTCDDPSLSCGLPQSCCQIVFGL